ncbi:unnamed protein product [Lathyrus oleraceus]
MTKIVKFIYVMIFFTFIFLVSSTIASINRCFRDSDCPPNLCKRPYMSKCVGRRCRCAKVITPIRDHIPI